MPQTWMTTYRSEPRYALEERIEELLGPSRSRGVNRSYPCPFHDERRPSFSINMEEGLWVCFACGLKGNYEQLCARFGAIPDQEYRWIKAQKVAGSSYHEPTDLRDRIRTWDGPGGDDSLLEGFYQQRGIRPESGRVYEVLQLGQRIAFPYIDVDGRVTGIKYRDRLGNKYAEPGSEFGIYGVVLGAGHSDVIVCEGESDTLRVHTELDSKPVGVVGTSGASVSEAQWTIFGLSFLFAQRIYLGYDADDAGDRAAETAMRVLGGDRCYRLRPTRGKDLTDHLQNGGSLREAMTGSI